MKLHSQFIVAGPLLALIGALVLHTWYQSSPESDSGRASVSEGIVPRSTRTLPDTGGIRIDWSERGPAAMGAGGLDMAALEAFDRWLGQWVGLSEAERETAVGEGVALATARRASFKTLIASNPERALSAAVPRALRQQLPDAITRHLEIPVSAAGQFDTRWTCTCGETDGLHGPMEQGHQSRVEHRFSANGRVYRARMTGGLRGLSPRPSAPLQGVAVDDELAVAPNSVRLLEPGERIPEGLELKSIGGGGVSRGASDESEGIVEIAGNYYSVESPEELTRLTREFEEWAFFEYTGSNSSGFFQTNYPNPGGKKLGSYKLLYIRVAYSDSLSTSHTEDSTLAQMRELERIYGNWSYGKLVVTSTLAPLITVPASFYNSGGGKDAGPIADYAQAEVRKLGYDPSQYDTVVILGDGIGGVAFGNTAAYSGGLGSLLHEVGHRIGAWHAGVWIAQDGTSYGFPGQNPEPEETGEWDWRYGNPFDVMGHYATMGEAARFNVRELIRLGWLGPGEYHQADQGGTYRIHSFGGDRLEHGKKYALVAGKNSVKNYYLEFRSWMGGVLDESALLLVGGPSETRLVDTTPDTVWDIEGDPGKRKLGIALGQTFSDLEADMHFTVLSRNDTVPPSLDIVYNKGPFPGNVAPELDAIASSSLQVPVGGTITFDASAAVDANADAMAYHWEFDDGVRVGNSAVVSRTFAIEGQVTVMVTVSDMKGGRVRRHVVVTVGNPGRQILTGRVTLDGQPLEHVRIAAAGGNFAYTDRSGNYALSNLPAGDTELSAIFNGYDLNPTTPNPVNVGAGANVVDWEAVASQPFVSLEKISDAVEGGSDGIFRFTRTGDPSSPLVVRVSNPGSLAGSADFALAPAATATTGQPNGESFLAFTIPAGDATLDVAVTATDDATAEGPEELEWHLNHNGNYLLNRASAVRMTLIDNDTPLPQVAVVAGDREAGETPGNPGSFTFRRSGSTAMPLDLELSWGGTALNGDDFPLLPPVVSIPAGQSAVTVLVQPVQDQLSEGAEQVSATLLAAPGYLIRAGSDTAIIDITDADVPVVTVSVADGDAAEAGETAGMFMIHRTGAVSAPLTIYYGLRGSALHGRDYQALAGEVVIPAGARSAPVRVTPIDDTDTEGSEIVELLLASSTSSYSVGLPNSGRLSIIDDENLPVVSVRTGAAGTEGQGSASIVFRAIGGASGYITVRYSVAGSATPEDDYAGLSGEIVIPTGGVREATLLIPPINDSEEEPTERVTITIIPDAAYAVEHDATADALIYDNDSGPVRVGVGPEKWGRFPSETAPTANQGRMRFTRTGPTNEELEVAYELGGTATNGTDYDELPGTVTIPAGQAFADVTFTVVDDDLGEGTETVVFTVSPGDGYSPDAWGSSTLEISDNDLLVPTIGFTSWQTLVSEVQGEGDGVDEIEVGLSEAGARDVSVEVVGGSGSSATGDNVDWTLLDGDAAVPSITLDFPAGTTSRTIRLRVREDGIAEGVESLSLALRRPLFGSLSSTNAVHEVLIFDGPVPPSTELVTEERWNGTAVYSNESWDDSPPAVTISRLGFTPPQNVADQYSRRMSGVITAPATGDYTFWIASDNASRLFVGTSASPASKVQRASVSGWTGFQSWDSNVSQRSQAVPMVAGQSYYVEVQHQEDGWADHVSVAWEGPGFSRRELSLVPGDGELPVLRFALERSARQESDGGEPGWVVYLDRPAGPGGVTADFTVAGSATAGDDYVLGSNFVTFGPGETTKNLPLAIVEDGVAEGPEWLKIRLSSPVGAQLGSPADHLVTISDAGAPVVENFFGTANSSMAIGTDLGGLVATSSPGFETGNWEILAGNTGNALSVTSNGRLLLANPAALPASGAVRLIVRVTDAAGSTGDGVVNLICNAWSNGVFEERWNGTEAYDANVWINPTYTGPLAALTSPQGIADGYSRRLISYLRPEVSGDYIFTIAGDDDCRLWLSTDESAENLVQIASVAGWTAFQSWTSQPNQRSVAIPLVAGSYYRIEAQQRELGGGDHVSVAWEGPGIARQPIPQSVLFNPAGVIEQRWRGSLPYSLDQWSGTPIQSGNSATFSAARDVDDNYSRRLKAYVRPTVSGDYSFWIAGDDDARLYLSESPSPLDKRLIAAVSGATGFQNWDSDAESTHPRQKSVSIPLVAGRLYWMEVHHREGAGSDHVSVAWQRDGGAREVIPPGQIFPALEDLDLGTPLVAPSIVLSSPAAALTMVGPQDVVLAAEVAGGSSEVTAVSFYAGDTLVGTDGVEPYEVTWSSVPPGDYELTARALIEGGSVRSSPVSLSVVSGDPAGDADGDGFTTGLELALGTDPYSEASQPAPHHAGMLGWWKLDDGEGTIASDSTGLGGDGTVEGATWIHRDSGHALRFDGVDDSVTMPGGLLGDLAEFTMFGRFRTSKSRGNRVGLWGQNDAIEFGIQGSNLSLWTAGGGSVSAPLPARNQWHDVACVGDGNGLKLYVDGVLVETRDTATSNYGDSVFPFRIGGGGIWDESGNTFNGRIDDVRLYERALTSDEIDAVRSEPLFLQSSLSVFASEGVAANGHLQVVNASSAGSLSYSKTSGPEWLMVASDGVLSGTPGPSDIGWQTATVRVQNSGGIGTQGTLEIEVNGAPRFLADSMVKPPANPAVPYAASLTGDATDPEGDVLVFSKLSGPEWLEIMPDGTLGGQPLLADTGIQQFVVRVMDPHGAASMGLVSIQVGSSLEFPVGGYGDLEGNDASDEFIQRVRIADLDHDSGSNGGYANFRNRVARMDPGQVISYTLTPGWTGNNYREAWTVWIDLNRDGDFDDVGEMILQLDGVAAEQSGSFVMPESATPGGSRMRVAMRFSFPQAEPTGSYLYGEVEDYSVQIGPLLPGNVAPYFLEDPMVLAPGDTLAFRAADWEGEALVYDLVSGPEWLQLSLAGDLTGEAPGDTGAWGEALVRVTDPQGGEDTAVLRIAQDPEGYGGWVLSKGLEGPASGFGVDADGDGLANGLEFVFGGEPNPAHAAANSTLLRPAVSNEEGDLVFTFLCRSEAWEAVRLRFHWSEDLDFGAPAGSVEVGPAYAVHDGVEVEIRGSDPRSEIDRVSIVVPAEKATNGRLFGRLEAEIRR